MGEPCPMEVVGGFKSMDPTFKGSYRDSLLYSEDDLARLRQQKVYLPTFQEEIPMLPAPSYWQNREPAAAKQSPCRVAALDTSVESTKTRHSSSKSEAQDVAPIPQLQSAQIQHLPRNPLIPRNQPWTARQSLCRPAVPGSMATHPLLPQDQPDAKGGIFMG